MPLEQETSMTPIDVAMYGPVSLRDTTMDQLRTLIAVYEAGSALGAARLLDRDQSSVQKQIDTLNRNFGAMCGEPLVLKRGRGQGVVFTETGESLVRTARETLNAWHEQIQICRGRVGGTLAVGTTSFTLAALTRARAVVAEEFSRLDVELRVEHVRSREILSKLRGRELDLVCGSIAVVKGREAPEDCAIAEWSRKSLSLVTNLPPEDLPGPVVSSSALRTLPLVLPDHGLIADSLRGWFGADYQRQLDVVAEIDTVLFGLELLASLSCLRGCMLVTHGIGEMVRDGRLATQADVRVLPVVNDTDVHMEVLSGAFIRRDEVSRDPRHPLSLLWSALQHNDSR
jgi:DNA-binding transcriptional LysR family regulator